MAKIRSVDTTDSSGNYAKVFGDLDAGMLISRVHSTSIRMGNALQAFVKSNVKPLNSVEDLTKIIRSGQTGVWSLNHKKIAGKNARGKDPDFVFAVVEDYSLEILLVEIKAGSNFDTKKSSGEKSYSQEEVETYTEVLGHLSPVIRTKFCCWNESDKAKIVRGFKGKITIDEAMTGVEIRQLLSIDQGEFERLLKEDEEFNRTVFFNDLLGMEWFKALLKARFGLT